MNVIYQAFKKYLHEICNDIMFAAIVFVPIIMGCLFRFGIPALESYLCNRLGYGQLITPYYFCFDLTMICITPVMFVFPGAMVILGEIDDGLAKYLIVTPLGKKGYLISRLGIMGIFSCVYDLILVFLFHLTKINVFTVLLYAVAAMLFGVTIAFIMISLSHNKVEGMAIMKFSTMMLLGVVPPFFLKDLTKYLLGFLPSFWLGEFIVNKQPIQYILCISFSIFYIILFYRKFRKKLL